MAALIRMDQGIRVQFCTMLFNELRHGFKDEIHLQRFTENIGQHLLRKSVQNGGQIAKAVI